MVDPLRVQTLLDRLASEIKALRRFAALDDEVLLGDEDLLAAVKYRFIVAIEVCIDVGRHIAASESLRAPTDYADVFTVLAEAELLTDEVVGDLRDTARFRNLLVHGYAEVNDQRVVEILKTRLGDLDRFRTSLAEAVSRRPPR